MAYNNKASAYHQPYPTFPGYSLPVQQNVVPFVRPSGLHVYGQPAYGSSYMPQASGLQQNVGNSLCSLGQQGFYAGTNLQYMGQAGSMLQPAAEMASSLQPEGHYFRADRHLPFTGKADSSMQQSYRADSSLQPSFMADSSNLQYMQQGSSDNVHALAQDGSNLQLQPSFKANSSNPHYMQQGSSDNVHALAHAGSSMQQIGQKSHMGSMQHALAEAGSSLQQMGQKSHMGSMQHALAEAGSSLQQMGQKSDMGSMQHLDQNTTAGSHSEGQQTVSRAGSIIQLLGQNFQADFGENQVDSYTVQQQQQLGQSGQAGSEWQKPGSHAGSSLQYEAEIPHLGSKMKHQELSSCSIEQGFQGNSNLMNQEQSSFAGRAPVVVLHQQMGRNPFPNSRLEETERSSCDGGNKQRFEQGDTVHLFKQSSSKIKRGQVITVLTCCGQFPIFLRSGSEIFGFTPLFSVQALTIVA
jgi:hypothetical protein